MTVKISKVVLSSAVALSLLGAGGVALADNTNANVNINLNGNSNSNSSSSSSSSASSSSASSQPNNDNGSSASSASSSSTVTMSQPILTLGSSLTASEQQEVVKVLEDAADVDGSNVQRVIVNGESLVKYLNPSGSNFTNNSGVWSSALVKKTDNGGINVNIVDYNGSDNITTITQNQYKNAALTAGITNADIYVTSPKPIDGSGALAGVYNAYTASGKDLNQNNINNAQQEQGLLSSITGADKDKNGYTDSQLNNAIAGAKQQMAQSNDPSKLSRQDIADIVDNELKKNGLDNVVTKDQANQIISLLQKIADSGVMNNSSFKNQAGKLSDNIQSKAKDVFNNLNNQGFWAKVKQFFSNVVDDIQNIF